MQKSKKVTVVLYRAFVLLFAMLMLAGCESSEKKAIRESAIEEYQALVIETQDIETKVAAKILEAEEIVKTTKLEEVVEESVVINLSDEIDSAKELSVDYPEVAKKIDEIKEQINTLTIIKNELEEATNDLQSAIEVIEESCELVLEYHSIIADINAIPDDIAEKITAGEALLESTTEAEVLEVEVLTNLAEAIEVAKKVERAEVPKIANSSEKVIRQIEELIITKKELETENEAIKKACDAIASSKQALANREREEQQARLDAAVSPNQTYNYIFKDGNGYQLKATIQIGSWIKGTETEMLQRAWANVGGRDNMPLTSRSYSTGSYGNETEQKSETAVYAFGKISFEYLTTDFPRENFAGGYIVGTLFSGSVSRNRTDKMGPMIAAIQYRDKISYYSPGGMDGNFVKPDMKKDTWGPVPFVTSVNNVFSPDNPNGNPEFDNVTLRFDILGAKAEESQSISLSKTW